jgi:hypothetical protein
VGPLGVTVGGELAWAKTTAVLPSSTAADSINAFGFIETLRAKSLISEPPPNGGLLQ